MRVRRVLRFSMLLRIALGCFGLWMLSVGARGLLLGHPLKADEPLGRWLLGGVIVHDAIIAPTVFVLCAIVFRLASVRVRQALAAILLIGGSALVVGLPDLLRKGDNANPTVTPLDYRRDLIIVLLAVAGGVLLVTAAGARRARKKERLAAAAEAQLHPEPQPTMMLGAQHALELEPLPEPVLDALPERDAEPPAERGDIGETAAEPEALGSAATWNPDIRP
jgi:hypothetical protein